jgi:hypothetical protein
VAHHALAHLFREPEIRDFGVVIHRDEDVVGLEVAVDDAAGVHKALVVQGVQGNKRWLREEVVDGGRSGGWVNKWWLGEQVVDGGTSGGCVNKCRE